MDQIAANEHDMRKLFGGVYGGTSVFVTGHTGFKGGWLALWLRSLGAEVTGYSLVPHTDPSLFEVARISEGINHVIGDVRDYDNLAKHMAESKPSVVFHLAAQAIVRESYLSPRETYETNVMGTVNVLEAVRRTDSVCACVVVTSDKCYENKEWAYSYRENDPMGGHDPYSSSKGCAELVSSAYRSSFFGKDINVQHPVRLASARAGNVIGGGDWAKDRLVPDCVIALSQEKPVIVRNPMAIRPWQHVLDPISAYLWLGALLLGDSPERIDCGWNIGPLPTGEMRVRDVVTAAIGAWGSGDVEFADNPNGLYEANLLRLDCSKAASHLPWTSCYDARKAIEETIKWYREYYYASDCDAQRFSIEQVEDFVRAAIDKGLAWTH
jgi:CDP-glucose 4,6-dehydratase